MAMRTAIFPIVMLLGLAVLAFADESSVSAQAPTPFFAQVRDKPVPPQTIPQAGETWILGGAFDINFRDVAPEGGLLIGFEAGYGKFVGHTILTALQPIYRTSGGDIPGERHGKNPRRDGSAYAKPGYAVGSLTVKAGLYVNGFKIRFMRVGNERLDPQDSYESAWIGGNTGGTEAVIGGKGARVYGLIGMTNKQHELTGIGLLFKKGDLSVTAKPSDLPKATPALNPALRNVQVPQAGLTKIFPGLAGDPFRDEGPKGSLLIGLHIGLGNAGGKDYVDALQPIYQTATGAETGQRYGNTLKGAATARAKDDYAVSGLLIKSSSRVESIKVLFARVAGAKLNRNDTYQTDWFGAGGGNETLLGGDATPIVGLIGKSTESDITGVGLILKTR
jgi:hypothetical protein